MVQSWTASSALGASMTDLSPGKTSWMGGGREGLSELMVVLVVLCSLAKKGPVPSPLSGRRASLLDFCEQIFPVANKQLHKNGRNDLLFRKLIVFISCVVVKDRFSR